MSTTSGSSGRVVMLLLVMLVSGGLNGFMVKLQNIQVVNPATKQKFFHPAMQVMLYFIASLLVGKAYSFRNNKQKSEDNENLVSQKDGASHKPPMPFYLAWKPACMDMFSMLLTYIALNMIDGSIVNISRGGSIITTALLSPFLLRKKLTKYEIAGSALAFIGITTAQMSSVLLSPSKNASSTNSSMLLLGLTLVFISVFFNSLTSIFERQLIEKYRVQPMELAGNQGMIGLALIAPIIIAFHFVPCPWGNTGMCARFGGEYVLQNFPQYFVELATNDFLIVSTMVVLGSQMWCTWAGLSLLKVASPLHRILGGVSRCLIIWGLGIGANILYGRRNPSMRLQSLDLTVNLFKLLGFVLLTGGMVLSNYQPGKSHVKEKDPYEYQKANYLVRIYRMISGMLSYKRSLQQKTK